MSGLLENIGNILTSIIIWLGQIASALIQNPIFIILMAVIIFRILYYSIKIIILEIKIKRSDKEKEWWNKYNRGEIGFDDKGNWFYK